MLRYKLKERIAEKEFAERRRIPIQEVAAESGIARNTLSRMINSYGTSVRSENLDRLCSYFGCRIDELVEHLPDDKVPHSAKSQKKKRTDR
jgi:putative transcriptional regulator